MSFVNVDPYAISGNPFQQIGKDWYLISAGTAEDFNMMTASWGFFGVMWGAPSVICTVRTNRHTFSYLEQEDCFAICFFDEQYRPALNFCGSKSGRDCDKVKETGLTPVMLDGVPAFAEAKRVLICKKRYAAMMEPSAFTAQETYDRWYGTDPMHKQYVAEILAVYEQSAE